MKEVHNISLKQNNGRIFIETLSVMLLLVLLGTCCLGLSLSAFEAYQRLNDSKGKNSELRIANSFIVNKIRQNDISGSIDVKSEPTTGSNALVIYENINGEDYATWIYNSSGHLMEALVLKNEVPSLDISQTIAEVDSFKIDYDREKNQILISVGIDGVKSYSSVIKLRSR